MTIDTYDRDGQLMPDDWYEHPDRRRHWVTDPRIARTTIGDITVSTVWLSIDHRFGYGPPLIFETMTFGEPWTNELRRYSTEEEAMRGHLEVLDRLRAGQPPFAHLDADADV